MPDSARKALKGLLADGVSADEVLDRLSGAGFDIKPPEGDDSYGDEKPAGAVIAIGVGKKQEGEESPEKEGNFHQKLARKAMKKHGYKP